MRSVSARRKSPRADTAANTAYHREWLKRPGNRERAREHQRRYLEKPGVREAMNARKREGRAASPRSALCKVCGETFWLPRGRVGRPRIYCTKCVRAFERSDRKCPRCGKVVDLWRRRLTCRSCGALWMRGKAA